MYGMEKNILTKKIKFVSNDKRKREHPNMFLVIRGILCGEVIATHIKLEENVKCLTLILVG